MTETLTEPEAQPAEEKKVLTDRETRNMFERSIARSVGCPQGLKWLFPSLKG